MGRSQNWAFMARALREGTIVTPEMKAAFEALQREKRTAKAERKAERDTAAAEREKRRPMINSRRAAYRAEETALRALAFGGQLTIKRYHRTSQVGMLCQRLKDLHGIWFTCKAIAGEGVRFERIYPPHAAPAGSDPNADLL